VVLDVGTNNQSLIDDVDYLGTRQVSVREKGRERQRMCVCEKERKRESMCQRKRERERECVCEKKREFPGRRVLLMTSTILAHARC